VGSTPISSIHLSFREKRKVNPKKSGLAFGLAASSASSEISRVCNNLPASAVKVRVLAPAARKKKENKKKAYAAHFARGISIFIQMHPFA